MSLYRIAITIDEYMSGLQASNSEKVKVRISGEQCYKEPGVDGKFEDITKTVLKDLELDADEETDSEAEDMEQAHDESGAGVREDMEQATELDIN